MDIPYFLLPTEAKTMTAPIAFAFLCLIIGSCYVAAVSFLTVPPENKDIVNIIIGFINGTMLGTSITYVIGTSSSSAKKDEAKKERQADDN